LSPVFADEEGEFLTGERPVIEFERIDFDDRGEHELKGVPGDVGAARRSGLTPRRLCRFLSGRVVPGPPGVRQCLSEQADRLPGISVPIGLFAPQHALRWDGDSCCHTRPDGKRCRYIALLVGKLGDESIVARWKKEAKRSTPRCLLSPGVLAEDVNRRSALE
jgi:hypothetical protein